MNEESTPLLHAARAAPNKPASAHLVYRLLLCAFIISLSVGFTWVPIIYVFRLMTCDEYYKHNPAHESGNRCDINVIEGSTAHSVSLLGMTTTVFGVINLFVTGWIIKKWGVKLALMMQTMWPAIRLCFQIVGVNFGAQAGISIIQISQIFCILGGPAGYLLVTNTYACDLVDASQRTAVFGKLSGCVMFGTSFGYLLGGVVGDIYGIRRPFEVALILMIFSTLYSTLCLPYIPASENEDTAKAPTLTSFLHPLKLFIPQKYCRHDGIIVRHYGLLCLGAGVFLGVLATGFVPVLIQLYATNAFSFGAADNGYLMALNSFVRGLFLYFAFPRIISTGRRCFHGEEKSRGNPESPLPPRPSPNGSAFDLTFLTWSLVIDGLLTASAALSRTGWQIYLAAVLLPFASGSAPAAKGVMMELCPKDRQADALSAITLVEMLATLSTMSVFGELFALFANMGEPHLIFICNAAVAVFAVAFLTLCRFPAEGWNRVET